MVHSELTRRLSDFHLVLKNRSSLRLAGQIALVRGDNAAAEASFRSALTLHSEDLLAAEGLARVQLATNCLQDGVHTYASLVSLLSISLLPLD